MANNLNFKWGNHASLPSTSTVGTLYFTKDEHSLYLGVDANKAPQRIQGVVQYYDSVTAFTSATKPPYASDVIYYIADQGALIRWDSVQKKFVVINVTASEFDSTVSNLSSDIATAQGDINGLKTTTQNLSSALGTKDDDKSKATAFGRIKDLEEAVEALEALTGSGSGSNSLTERIAALENWKTTANSDITNLKSDMADVKGDITALEGEDEALRADLGQTGDDKSKATAFGRIKALETDNTTSKQNISDLQTTVGGHTTSITTINGNVSQLSIDLANLSGDVNKKAEQSDLTALTTKVGNVETVNATQTENIGKNAQAIEEVKTSIGASSDATTKNTVYGTINKVAADVATNTGSINTINDKIDGIEDEISTIKETNTNQGSAISNLQSTVGGHTTDINGLKDRMDTAENDIDQNASDIADITGNITTLTGKFDDYYTKDQVDNLDAALKSNLEGQLATHIKAANALTFKSGISSSSDWNTVKVKNAKIGDTYVVTAISVSLDLDNNSNTAAVTCYAGDFLIATVKSGASEDANGDLTPANTVWMHVNSGYKQDLDNDLRVIDSDGTSANKEATIQLTSYPGVIGNNYGDLGSVKIKSITNNLEVTVGSSNDVSVNMVWDTF